MILDILFEKVWEEENLKFDEKDKLSEEVEEIYGYEFLKKILAQNVMDFHFHNLNQEKAMK